ncbi:ATP-binding protein [Humibacter antri]
MYVKRLLTDNFKRFNGSQEFHFIDGLNLLVGDNNCGKSSIFEAILFAIEGPPKWKPEDILSRGADCTRVEMDLAGGIDALVHTEKFSKLVDYVFDDGSGEIVLRLERWTKQREVTQNKRSVVLDGKKLCFWNPATAQFENPTGIDALAKALIDFEAVWADTNPTDVTDFGATKTLGRLLDAVAKPFLTTDQWKSFTQAHGAAFGNGDESLASHAVGLARQLEDMVGSQYGPASMRFGFDLPDAGSFLKLGRLLVDDGAGETEASGKGTGMQRALALAIIQLYARSEALADPDSPRPLVLLLDEPETWLHPNAQLRLGDALSAIADAQQLFLITHSPYLLRRFSPDKHRLAVLARDDGDLTVEYSHKFGVLGLGEPSWGEINYRAFGIYSYEFHDEIYGAIQRDFESRIAPPRDATQKEIERFLVTEGIPTVKLWTRTGGAVQQQTLPTYIRNSIHHPENNLNARVTEDELANSTDTMLDVWEKVSALPTSSAATTAA